MFMPGQSRNDVLETDYADITRALLRFRFDKAFQGAGNRVPLARVAALCSLSRQTIHNLASNTPVIGLLPETARRIRSKLDLILKDGLRWRRQGTQWVGFYPDGSPLPPQPQLPKLSNTKHDYPHL